MTHVRLCQYPDGGVARLRVHGDVVPDPRYLSTGTVDLAALENGGTISGCSNMFYSSPTNLISPGQARVMGEGWETSRRRDEANDWVEFALAGPGLVELAELDTSYFVGNAPGWASLHGCDARIANPENPTAWIEILPRARLQPDTRHRFRLSAEREVTHVRLDVYPDGGMARVRLWGDLSAGGREDLAVRWFNLLPQGHAMAVLAEDAGLTGGDAEKAVANRPAKTLAELPSALRNSLAG
jgi:allantoicase